MSGGIAILPIVTPIYVTSGSLGTIGVRSRKHSSKRLLLPRAKYCFSIPWQRRQGSGCAGLSLAKRYNCGSREQGGRLLVRGGLAVWAIVLQSILNCALWVLEKMACLCTLPV